MKSSRWLSINLIRSPVHYVLCMNARAFEEALDHLKAKGRNRADFLSPRADATTHFFTCNGKKCAVVCLGPTKGKTVPEVHGLLIHEAVHIWQEVCECMGEREPSHEFEAYSIQWIAQELIWSWNMGKGQR